MAKIQITDEEVQAECERLRGLGKPPYTDLMLTELIRSKAAPIFFNSCGRGLMTLGDFKKRLVAGDHPAVVYDFLHCPEFETFVRWKLKAAKQKKNYKLKGPGLVAPGVGYGVQF